MVSPLEEYRDEFWETEMEERVLFIGKEHSCNGRSEIICSSEQYLWGREWRGKHTVKGTSKPELARTFNLLKSYSSLKHGKLNDHFNVPYSIFLLLIPLKVCPQKSEKARKNDCKPLGSLWSSSICCKHSKVCWFLFWCFVCLQWPLKPHTNLLRMGSGYGNCLLKKRLYLDMCIPYSLKRAVCCVCLQSRDCVCS